jgi:hypothetical protein
MSIENSRRKPGEGWVAIVQRNGTKEFAAAFAPNNFEAAHNLPTVPQQRRGGSGSGSNNNGSVCW